MTAAAPALLLVAFLAQARQAADPPWGSRGYEEESRRYTALVAALDQQAHQLLSRIGQVRNDTDAFLGGFPEAERQRLVQEYERGADYRNRKDLFDRRYEQERSAKALYDDAAAVYTAEDERRAEARASLWPKSLDWRRRRLEARQAQLALLESQLVALRDLGGSLWADFFEDTADDIVAVSRSVLQQYPRDVADCFVELLGSTLAGEVGKGPTAALAPRTQTFSLRELAVEGVKGCVAGSAMKVLVNALEAAWREQFLDRMRERDVLREVAEYWWDEIVAARLVEEKGLVERIRGALEVDQVAAGALEAHTQEVAIRALASQDVKLRQAYDGLIRNPRIRSQAEIKQRMLGVARERQTERAGELMKAAKLVVDYGGKLALLWQNSAVFGEIEANEVGRYRRVVECLRAQGQSPTAEAVKSVLKRDGVGWAAFLKECRVPGGEGQCRVQARELAAALDSAAREVVAFERARIDRLQASLASLEGEAQGAASRIEQGLAQVRRVCAEAAAEAQRLAALEAELLAAAQPQAGRVQDACAAGDAAHARGAAQQARELASRLRERLASARGGAAPSVAPAPVELAPLRARAAALVGEAEALAAEARQASSKEERLSAAMRSPGDFLLGPCDGRGLPEVEDLRQRVARLIQQGTPKTRPPAPEEMDGLRGRSASALSRLDERSAAQTAARACLAADPSRAIRTRLGGIVAEAEAGAGRAEACAPGTGRPPGAEPRPAFAPGALVGRPLREAVGLVTAAGLEPRPQAGAPAPSPGLEGTIASATLQGNQVILVVYTARVAAGRVPNVVGRPLREAYAAVAAAGFTPVMEVGEDAPTPAAVHTIASQSPAAGTEAAAGKDVVLRVYSESSPGRTVPSLVGQRVAEARGLLESRELFLDLAAGDAAPSPRDAGRIYRQYPEPGIEIPRGTTVQAWVHGAHEGSSGSAGVAGSRGEPPRSTGAGLRPTAAGPLTSIEFPERVGWLDVSKPGQTVRSGNGRRLDEPPAGWNRGSPIFTALGAGTVHRVLLGAPDYMLEPRGRWQGLYLSVYWAEPGDPGTLVCAPPSARAPRQVAGMVSVALLLRSPRSQAVVELTTSGPWDRMPDESILREAFDPVLAQLEPHAKPCP